MVWLAYFISFYSTSVHVHDRRDRWNTVHVHGWSITYMWCNNCWICHLVLVSPWGLEIKRRAENKQRRRYHARRMHGARSKRREQALLENARRHNDGRNIFANAQCSAQRNRLRPTAGVSRAVVMHPAWCADCVLRCCIIVL